MSRFKPSPTPFNSKWNNPNFRSSVANRTSYENMFKLWELEKKKGKYKKNNS